jgi:cytochrome b
VSATSASPVETSSSAPGRRAGAAEPGTLVWDLPVRVFHWLAVLCFAGAWLTSESEAWRLVHVTLGYTLAGLVGFRVVWGLVGTRHARFASFVRGPKAVLAYLRSLVGPRPEHHTGHNPAGALAVIALLALAAGVTASGWAIYNELGPELLEELHEALASLMLALVGVHVAAVVISSRLHRENLVQAMVTGHKPNVPAGEGIRRAWRPLGLLLLAAVLGFWGWQWVNAPQGGDPGASGPGLRLSQPGGESLGSYHRDQYGRDDHDDDHK